MLHPFLSKSESGIELKSYSGQTKKTYQRVCGRCLDFLSDMSLGETSET